MLPLWVRVGLGLMAMKEYSTSPKLQHYCSLTIRLFNIISRSLVDVCGGSYVSAEMQSQYSIAPANWAVLRERGSPIISSMTNNNGGYSTLVFWKLKNIVTIVMLFRWVDGIRMCPWCNSYCREKWIQLSEFKSWTQLFVFHIALIPLGKVGAQLFSLLLLLNNKTDFNFFTTTDLVGKLVLTLVNLKMNGIH